MMQQVVYQSGAVDQSDQFQILDKVDSGRPFPDTTVRNPEFYYLALCGALILSRNVS